MRPSVPTETGEFTADCERYSRFWTQTAELLARLPAKPARSRDESEQAETLKREAREARKRFLRAHADSVYDNLTASRTRFVRLEQLVYDAAALVPGLTPTREEVAKEATLLQRDKDGVEIDQGILLWACLASPSAGRHLCHAMLLPRPEARERLPEMQSRGKVDFGQTEIERRGKASFVTLKNARHMNAEDNSTIDGTEIAVDLAILDPATEIAVLRGDVVHLGKYRGKRVLGSGINLTHLYQGRIPYVWYMQRDLGMVHKIFRGLARPDAPLDDVGGETIEKAWMAVVEGFAIGGHCQYLLTMDYVLAADDAYMTLPARKEGIIPGAANLRMPRFTGDRIAREAIMYERRIDCATPDGRLICDEVVPAAGMESAIARVVDTFTNSGVVSVAANRRAFRVTEEPLDDFRNYFAVYALEQAYCHFSPALIANLERYWDAQNRKRD
jgi:(3,5-dihydroxyphenyl)acetyl-CoA 1,2-dioxygenase